MKKQLKAQKLGCYGKTAKSLSTVWLNRQTEFLNMLLDCQNYTYRFVMNVLENKMTEAQDTISEKPLPKHDNLRGKAHYQQLELNYNTK